MIEYDQKKQRKITKMITCLKFKANVVYGDGVLPGKILSHASKKWLCEVEAREPEDCRRAVIYPILSGQTSNDMHRYKNI